MPLKKLQTQRLPPFVRLKTVRAMTDVAKVMGTMQADVKEMERARKELASGDESKQKAALMDIAICGGDVAAKADRLTTKVAAIRTKLENYLKQVKTDASH